ncbi:MAG: flagellar export protein FliJ [Gammaproteobacteria bacterium]|jgi:flagellar export protein FliJ|nr:flagellar export protein FliJ [Gammaproteobacteria bacterium]
MARKQPFGSLQTLARGHETRWQRNLSAKLKTLQVEEQRLDQLTRFAEEYGANATEAPSSQSIMAVRGRRQFVDRLRDAVGQQRKAVAVQQAAADRDLAKWQQARAQRLALDRYADRQLDAEARKRERSAQRQLDEVGNRTFLRRRDP